MPRSASEKLLHPWSRCEYPCPMNLADAFASTARIHAEKTAIFWAEQRFSYAAVQKHAAGVARELTGHFSVQSGDRVALWLKNCPEFVFSLFGIFQSGAVVVPINNFLKPAEVEYILNDAGIDVLITDAELAVHSAQLKQARPTLQILRIDNLPADSSAQLSGKAIAESSRAESDLAVIIYTSGTTGRPKGAMLSHGNLLHNVESCRVVLQSREEDRFAVILPLFHSYMLTVGTLLPIFVGGSMVLVKSLNQPKQLFHEIITNGANVIPAIPAFYRTMTSPAVPGNLPLRLCLSGAAPLPVQVLQDFEAKFGVPLIEGYGLSEASPVVTKNPLNGTRKPGSIGIPIANVEVSVQDESGNLLPDNEIGEICVRGGNVMMGYWNKPEETAKAIRNGWLLTGDVGRRDTDGYYYITDRKKDMLLVNGINVYPREIEEVMYQFPGVKEAAVIGVPDARRGEQPLAFVAAMDGNHLDERALLGFVREKLADYKVPRRLVVLPALPRNATGKILKTSLRELAKDV